MLKKYYEKAVATILRPAIHRLGTAIGATLTALGMAQDDMQIVAAAVPIVLGFILDLVVRKVL